MSNRSDEPVNLLTLARLSLLLCLFKLASETIVDVYLNNYAFFYFYIGFILPLCVGELFIA